MAGRFEQIFGAGTKPLIAMAHLGPLPGTPLHDEASGVQGIVDGVARDLDVLLQFPFDAVMFCNEGDRPYSLRAGFEGVAVMTRVAADLAPRDRPFGVDFLWDGPRRARGRRGHRRRVHPRGRHRRLRVRHGRLGSGRG